MGYKMSKLRSDELNYNDHEFFHLTKLRSEPSEMLRKATQSRHRTAVSTVKMLLGREANFSVRGRFSSADCSHVLSRYLPVNGPWLVDSMDTRAYVSQFSADGSLCMAAYQGSHIRIYDVENGWRVRKDIIARSLRWTITDASLSSDQRYLVYASMSPVVHIVNVGSSATKSYANITEIHEGLDFSAHDDGAHSFRIFSVKFSNDGRQLVAGTSDEALCVYDLGASKVSSWVPAHEDDVNTVTFADESGNLIFSGSDDSLCKVWDNRCFSIKRQAAGVLTGHLEGITFIDSRGDGRYFISNGKDQTTKLWDIRKMTSNDNCLRPRTSHWDYRWMEYPLHAKHFKHPHDLSISTYIGHSVLGTLIRCYFSPAHSTGQKYIYTGSHDNCVYIYDVITGDQLARLNCHQLAVRDCSWHPYYPVLVSSSWDGIVARWEFPGNSALPALDTQTRGDIQNQLYQLHL